MSECDGRPLSLAVTVVPLAYLKFYGHRCVAVLAVCLQLEFIGFETRSLSIDPIDRYVQ